MIESVKALFAKFTSEFAKVDERINTTAEEIRLAHEAQLFLNQWIDSTVHFNDKGIPPSEFTIAGQGTYTKNKQLRIDRDEVIREPSTGIATLETSRENLPRNGILLLVQPEICFKCVSEARKNELALALVQRGLLAESTSTASVRVYDAILEKAFDLYDPTDWFPVVFTSKIIFRRESEIYMGKLSRHDPYIQKVQTNERILTIQLSRKNFQSKPEALPPKTETRLHAEAEELARYTKIYAFTESGDDSTKSGGSGLFVTNPFSFVSKVRS